MTDQLETPLWIQLIKEIIRDNQPKPNKKEGPEDCELSIENLVYRRIDQLDRRINRRVIPFPELRQHICPIFCLKKDELNVVLKRLENMGLIEIVNKHGIVVV